MERPDSPKKRAEATENSSDGAADRTRAVLLQSPGFNASVQCMRETNLTGASKELNKSFGTPEFFNSAASQTDHPTARAKALIGSSGLHPSAVCPETDKNNAISRDQSNRTSSPGPETLHERRRRSDVVRSPEKDRSNDTAEAERLQTEMNQRHGVEFAKPNEKFQYAIKDKAGSPTVIELKAGTPTVAELKTLHEQLENTRHEDYKGMKIWFIQKQPTGNPEEVGYHAPKKEGNPAQLLILPDGRRTVTGGWNGTAGVIAHELGHQEQENRDKGKEIGEPGTDEHSQRLAQRLGWVYDEPSKKMVLQDKTGGRWKFNDDTEKWQFAGGMRPKDGAHTITNLAMQDRALVRPPTDYFETPSEWHAEGVGMFRIDRARLARSPETYKAIRDYDQSSVDRAFGKNERGESKMIRDLDGKLMPNSPQARARIERMERIWGIR